MHSVPHKTNFGVQNHNMKTNITEFTRCSQPVTTKSRLKEFVLITRLFKMSDNKNKDMKNPMAEAANWEARCVTEEEAPHKWNEAWGQMFTSGIPHDYAERIEFLENELKQCSALERPPKYGGSAPFPRMGAASFVKIPYDQPTWFSDAELDKTWAEMQKRKKDGNA